MFARHVAAGLVATALLSTAALAQTSPSTPAPSPSTGQSSSTPRAETPARPEQTQSTNEWRGSKVIGLYVYNDAGERLGSINDLLMDSSGKVSKAVIGVGGFLGIGESNIAVNFDQLKFSNEPMRTSSTSGSSSSSSSDKTTGSTSTTSSSNGSSTSSKPSVNPDHASLSMTKEQLQALPQFKFAN